MFQLTKGCPFASRYPHHLGPVCDNEPPQHEDADDHVIACHIPLQELRRVEPLIKTPETAE